MYYQSNAETFQSPLKKGKRLYPKAENPMDVRPELQSNRDHQNYNTKVVPSLSNLSLLPNEPAAQVVVNRNFDVPFLGNAPLIHDLDLPPPTPQIPASATITLSHVSQCDNQKCSLNALPYSSNLLKRSKLPLSLLIEPYPRAKKDDDNIPLISNGVITRCTRCKSFINPFIQFIDDGKRWKCNICNFDGNHVPTSYDWNNVTRQRMDRWSVPELNHSCVEYVATSEFLARPPQPPVYVFVIDISSIAIETGMISTFAEALVECIDKIPNSDERTRIGFITVSQSIGFYSLGSQCPEWLMVPDVDDVYLPRMTSELLVNLAEAKQAVVDLLLNLKNMVSNQRFMDSNNCLGSALKAARLLLSSTGGKIICFQASLPNIGHGALPPSVFQRKKCAVTGDSLLFEPASDFYRAFAEECVRSHICADMFVFGSQSVDVATLNVVPRFTGGQTHYYPGFSAKNASDNQKLKHELQKLLQENMGLEALIRTKCSPGLVCKAFHGNFTLQSSDILVLPNVPRDGSYCIDLAIEGELHGDLAYIQTCMLYTSTLGERLLRVMTTCLPVVREMSKVYYNADQVSIARSIAHQAIERAVTYKIRDAKEYMVQQTTSIFKAYSKEIVGVVPSKSQQLNLCRSLSMLPGLVLSLLKSEAFNDRGFVPVNISTQSALLLRTLPTSLWLRYVYPSFYSLHNMPVQSGSSDAEGNIIMPPRLNLSSQKLERHGCYLLEDEQRILIWIGRAAVPKLCQDLLDIPNINQVTSGQILSLPVLDNSFSRRANSIVKHIRTTLRHSNFYPTLYVIKDEENSVLNNWFMTHLLEDEQQLGSHRREMIPNSTMSYAQWLSFIKSSM